METPLLSSSPTTPPHAVAIDVPSDARKIRYDVFLNVAAEDSIVSRLRCALANQKCAATVAPEGASLDALEELGCAVVVFTPHFSASGRRLDELVKIVGSAKARGLTVVPVFCHVEAVDVRKRRGAFGAAFSKVEERFRAEDPERVHRWKVALIEVAGLGGFDLQNFRDEAHLVEAIVSEVSSRLDNVSSSKTVEDDKCNIMRLICWGTYGLKSIIGSIGFLLVCFLIVFPLFGIFVFIVAPCAISSDGGEMIRSSAFAKHFSRLLFLNDVLSNGQN